MPNEPGYFQEFGPGGFHVAIGFANPAIINARKDVGTALRRARTGGLHLHASRCRSPNNAHEPHARPAHVQQRQLRPLQLHAVLRRRSGSPDGADFAFAEVRRRTARSRSPASRRASSRSPSSTSGTTSCSTAWSTPVTVDGSGEHRATDGVPGHAMAHQPVHAHVHRPERRRRVAADASPACRWSPPTSATATAAIGSSTTPT